MTLSLLAAAAWLLFVAPTTYFLGGVDALAVSCVGAASVAALMISGARALADEGLPRVDLNQKHILVAVGAVAGGAIFGIPYALANAWSIQNRPFDLEMVG